MSQRQAVLDGLQLSPQDAISLADIPSGTDGVKPVSTRMQKRLLQFLAGFSSDQCWLSTENIAQRLNHTERTIRATLRVLVAADLVVESGPRNRRFRAVHWTEIGRRVPRISDNNHPVNRSIPSGQFVSNGPVPSGQFVPNGPVHPVTSDRIQNKEVEETTTTGKDVVVVELEKVLAKAAKAVNQARARGLGDEAIRERIQRWRELPDDARRPGVLYNWIALDGSYSPQVESKPVGRGDALSKSQIADEGLRMRIVRAGRAAGASQEAIERRLASAGL